MTNKLISLDLDGTTLNNQSKLTDKTKSVLKQLSNQGHIIAINTGRPFRTSKHIYEDLGINTPLVNFNGALCHHPGQKDWTDGYHRKLNKDFVLDLMDQKEQMGIDQLCVEGVEKFYVDKKTIPDFAFYQEFQNYSTLEPGKLEEIPTAVTLFTEESAQERVRRALLERYGQDISVRVWGGMMPCLEIVSPGVQKAIGLEHLAKHYGISMKDTISFGDEENDYEMIEQAGLGVAMRNAKPEILAIANDVTELTNDQDGVANYLEKLLLK